MNEATVLSRLYRDIETGLSISAFAEQGSIPNALRIQFLWGGTDGVYYLEVYLIPEHSPNARPILVKTLSPSHYPQNVICSVNRTGLFRILVRAVLADNKSVDTDLAQSQMILLGKIHPLRYRIEPRRDGWQKLTISSRSMALYADRLYIQYDNCRYLFPQENGTLAGTCYIPSKGEITLSVSDHRLPQPKYDE